MCMRKNATCSWSRVNNILARATRLQSYGQCDKSISGNVSMRDTRKKINLGIVLGEAGCNWLSELANVSICVYNHTGYTIENNSLHTARNGDVQSILIKLMLILIVNTNSQGNVSNGIASLKIHGNNHYNLRGRRLGVSFFSGGELQLSLTRSVSSFSYKEMV